MVLRCDNCVSYHVGTCAQEGVSDDELRELISVALIVGGSITIPRVRRALQTWIETRAVLQNQ